MQVSYDDALPKQMHFVEQTVYECCDTIVSKALELLSVEERTCLLLQVDEGFSYNEIADIVDLSEEEVKHHLSRARQNLYHLYQALSFHHSDTTLLPQKITPDTPSPCSEWLERLSLQTVLSLSLPTYTQLREHLLMCIGCATRQLEYRWLDAQIRRLFPCIFHCVRRSARRATCYAYDDSPHAFSSHAL